MDDLAPRDVRPDSPAAETGGVDRRAVGCIPLTRPHCRSRVALRPVDLPAAERRAIDDRPRRGVRRAHGVDGGAGAGRAALSHW